MKPWLLACAFLLSQALLQACTCVDWPSAPGAWEGTPRVFVGRVLTASPSGEDERDYMLQQNGTLLVEEAFKGSREGETLRFSQASHGCAPKFRLGERYVFYVVKHPDAEVWEAPGCHRTRTVSEGADDLLFLRGLPRAAGHTRLSGEVEIYEDSVAEGFRKVRNIAGARVTVRNRAGVEQTVQTNSDGVYELYDLTNGDYEVSTEIPAGMSLRWSSVAGATDLRATSKLPGTRKDLSIVRLAKGSTVEVSFVLSENNRIAGKVTDAEGKPMKDVCLKLEPAEGKASQYFYKADCSEEDGSFEMREMPSGRYILVANDDGVISSEEPFGIRYYPDVKERERAQVLSVTAGQHLDDLRFQMHDLARRVRVSGRLEFRDGKPVPFESIRFKPIGGQEAEHFAADENGTFSLELLAGRPGNLVGELFAFSTNIEKACPQFQQTTGRMPKNPESSPVIVAAEGDQRDIVLTLNVDSCAGWVPRKR